MDGDESENFKKFMNDVKATAKNGIVLSGVLSWVDIQTHTTADSVRQEQMASLFTLEEIEEAVEDLWAACGGEDSVIGPTPRRNNVPNKVKNLVDDIFKAFKKLSENDKKPAILATSIQMRTIRPYNIGNEVTVNQNDVMERVKLLEECINNQNKMIADMMSKVDTFTKTQSEKAGLTAAAVHQPPPPPPGQSHSGAGGPAIGPPSRTTNLINQAFNGNLRTPKRKRVSDENESEQLEAGMDWAKVAGRNLNRRTGPVLTEADTGATPRAHWRQKSLLILILKY